MHRIMLLVAVLTKATVSETNSTESTRTTEVAGNIITFLPTVFRNSYQGNTPKPRHQSFRQNKADSPMLNYIFDSYAASSKHFHDKFLPPSFENDLKADDSMLDADTGATVEFDCRVSSLRDKIVSWLKVSDDHNLELLTVDLDTHTRDSRYRVDIAAENWKLSLSNAKVQDSGIYCCHVSTHPPLLKRVQLTVHPPEIIVNKETFLETGETLSLKCAILHLSSKDVVPELHWYKGNISSPVDELRGGVLIETNFLTLTSHLQVANLNYDDAGNYTCALEAPIQMKAISRVHVLHGSSLAELQSGVKTSSNFKSLLLSSFVLVVLEQNLNLR